MKTFCVVSTYQGITDVALVKADSPVLAIRLYCEYHEGYNMENLDLYSDDLTVEEVAMLGEQELVTLYSRS